MRIKRILGAFVLLLCGCVATSTNLAVKRGQKEVQRTELPFVCIAFGTKRIGMPINSVSVRNLSDGRLKVFVVAKSIGSAHPDYLTAVAGDTVLSLVTLHLSPGEYVLEQITYSGAKNDSFDYTFQFSKPNRLTFKVAPDAVNYVGSVEFSASWRPEFIIPIPNQLNDYTIEKSLPTRISVKHTAERDSKWVHDEIPALRDLPSVFSTISEITALE